MFNIYLSSRYSRPIPDMLTSEYSAAMNQKEAASEAIEGAEA
jgi:hypothetical protein